MKIKWKKTEGKKKGKNNSLKYIIILTLIVFVIVIFTLIITRFPIDYTNGNVGNSTIAQNNAKTMIAAQTVPTVINGIIASTAIIIGFSATLVGIFFRDVFSNDNLARQILIGFLVMYVFAIGFISKAYSSLTTIGQFSLEESLRYALMALNFSIFLLLFVFLFFAILNERDKEINFERCRDY
jgi:hypothetical protein